MEKLMYMMMIEKSKSYHKMTKQVVMEQLLAVIETKNNTRENRIQLT